MKTETEALLDDAWDSPPALREASDLQIKKKPPTKKYEDYLAVINAEYAPRRCLLRGELMTFDRAEGCWVPLMNYLGTLRSKCRDFGRGWNPDAVKDCIERLEKEVTPLPLIEAAPWDGRDRVREMAFALRCSNYGPEAVDALVKDWGAKMMRRIQNPRTRQRLLCLRGPEEKGKDWWIDALIGAWDTVGYKVDLSLRDEHEALMQLHTGVVFYISEFDKTAKMSGGFLKDIIDRVTTCERLKHDRRAQRRVCRGSFIASANPKDVLRDPGENTRYIILDVEAVDFNYPGHEKDPDKNNNRMQILSQFKHLADGGYVCSAEVEKERKDDISERTPIGDEQAIAELFDHHAWRTVADHINTDGKLLKDTAESVVALVARDERLSVRTVKNILRRAGRDKKSMSMRYWKVCKLEGHE